MEISSEQYRRINIILTVVVIVFGLYLLLAPFLPEVSFYLSRSKYASWLFRGHKQPIEAIVVTPRTSMAASEVPAEVVPQMDTLHIPSIGVLTPVLEGQTSKVLEQGIWRRPQSSTPDAGSNTVLVGHRFLYTSGQNTFYHLDKVKVGEEIELWWAGKKYTYIVDSILVTLPTAAEIEQPTSQPMLTLYTCTPLFSVDKRLVVRAYLKE